MIRRVIPGATVFFAALEDVFDAFANLVDAEDAALCAGFTTAGFARLVAADLVFLLIAMKWSAFFVE
jgi:hypothetical protein